MNWSDGRVLRRSVMVATMVASSMAVAVPAVAAPPSARDCGGTRARPCSIVATVGDRVITRAEYEHWYAVLGRSTGTVIPDPPRFTKCIRAKRETLDGAPTRKQLRTGCVAESAALRTQAMQLLISVRWLQGEAGRQGVTASPSEVRQVFREQRRASFPKRRDYEKFLRQSGQTEADILLRVELDVLSNKIRDRVGDAAPPVTGADVQRYYDRNRSRFVLPERRDLEVVVTKTDAAARAALARVEAGERWASVVEDLSIDPASRSRGGRLRGVVEGQLGRALDRAVFAAERGALVGPVRTQFGFYVFRVVDVRPARRQSFQEVRSTIRQVLRSERATEQLDAFVREFTNRWRARTFCRPAQRTPDCANGPPARPEVRVPTGAW